MARCSRKRRYSLASAALVIPCQIRAIIARSFRAPVPSRDHMIGTLPRPHCGVDAPGFLRCDAGMVWRRARMRTLLVLVILAPLVAAESGCSFVAVRRPP